MSIELQLANLHDATEIHEMQILAFKPLLEKYHDYELSPAAESIDRTIERLGQPFTHYYKIVFNKTVVGAIRVIVLGTDCKYKISPIFILPQYQNRGVAQKVFSEIERIYVPKDGWELETIEEESGNCHLYRKLGYEKSGEGKRINSRMTLIHMTKAPTTNRPDSPIYQAIK